MIIAFKGFINSVRESTFILNVGGVFYELKATKKVLEELHQGDEKVIYVCKQGSNIFGFSEEQDMNNFKEILIANPNMPPNVILRLLNVNPSLNKEDINKTLHDDTVGNQVQTIKEEVISACKNLGYQVAESSEAYTRVIKDQLGNKVQGILKYKTEDLLPYVLTYLQGGKK